MSNRVKLAARADGYPVLDEFCGEGGSSKGWDYIPGAEVVAAANHNPHAIRAHALNFPKATHYEADITKLAMEDLPHADVFSASPVCPPYSNANGVRVDFDLASMQQAVLFDASEYQQLDPKTRERLESYKRARLLMHEVPRYLRAQVERGTPVLIGVVENVPQARKWAEWKRWVREIEKLGYRTRLIALNSMHAQPVRAPLPPQSRDRLYLAYWHTSLNRDPDWNKWLRPVAWCPACDTWVNAVQVFKKRGADMGDYGAQYVYMCPSRRHRQEVFPPVRPALSALDLTNPGTRIGDRDRLGMRPLAQATVGRIRAGYARYWMPFLCPVGGTWRAGQDGSGARPLTDPVPTRTTRETDAIAVPPLLVPVEGRPGKHPNPADQVMRTQTTRGETAVATPVLPFITPLRGGGDRGNAYSTASPAGTVTASGQHHGLACMPLVMRNQTPRGGESRCTPADEPARTVTANGRQTLLTLWSQQLLVPYYGNRRSQPAPAAASTVGTLTTKDRYGVATPGDRFGVDLPDTPGPQWTADDITDAMVNDVYFRMLDPVREIPKLMGFDDDWQLLTDVSKTILTWLHGNAVTPAAMEVIGSALFEAMTGEDLPRGDWALAA